MNKTSLLLILGAFFPLACTAPPLATTGCALTDTHWTLVHLTDRPLRPLATERAAHLVLHGEGQRVSGSGGCNRLLGQFAQEGQALRFARLGRTMMACPELDDEQFFLDTLDKVRFWRIAGTRLELLDDKRQPLAEFSAPQSSTACGRKISLP